MVTKDNDEHSDPAQLLSRRRLLATSGIAAAGLAGCLGDDDSPGNGDDSTGNGDDSTGNGDDSTGNGDDSGNGETPEDISSIPPRRPAIRQIMGGSEFVMENYNFNWHKAETQSGFARTNRQAITIPNRIDGVTSPALVAAESIEATNEGCTKEVQIKDGVEWWDGTTVTGEGLALDHEIRMHQAHGPDPWEAAPEEIEVVGDGLYRWHYDIPKNESYITGVLHDIHSYHPKFHRPWAERYRDATTDDEVNDITEELGSEEITPTEFVDEGLGSGLFKPSEWTETSMTWEKWDDHILADETNIQRWEWETISETAVAVEEYKRGNFDILTSNATGVVDPDDTPHFEQIYNQPSTWIQNINFNMEGKFVEDRAVRRAMAYLLDYEELMLVQENANVPGVPSEQQTGVANVVAENWYGEEFLDQIIDYGVNAEPDKATQVLEDAGYSKPGNRWVDPDGQTMEGIKFINASIHKIEVVGQYITSMFDQFGFGIDHTIMNAGAWGSARAEADHDFSINHPSSGTLPGNPTQAYVTSAYNCLDRFDQLLPEDYEQPTPEGGCGPVEITEEDIPYTSETGPENNQPVHAEFPVEVGQMELGNDTQQLKPFEWRWTSQMTSDREYTADVGRKFGWYTNFDLPMLTLYDETFPVVANTEDFVWRNEDLPEERRGVAESTSAPLHVIGGAVYSKPEE